MESAQRHAEANAHYQAGQRRVKTIDMPHGQKYPPGTRVKIVNGRAYTGMNATVKYSYAHAYGGDNVDSYCLDIDEYGEVAWFDEEQTILLTPFVEIRP